MTGNDIFERALDLCALHSGDAVTVLREDLQDLKARAVSLVNVLIAELTPLHERLTGEKTAVKSVSSLAATVNLHEGICASLLPFKLAALLIADEDRELAQTLEVYAREARASLLADGKSTCRRIVEVYG